MGQEVYAAMAEENETTTPEGEGKQETDATSELGEAGKRALDAERRARAAAEKRAKELEAKVKEAEDAEKTEVERLTGQVADLKKRAEDAESKADRFEVAAAKGLSLAQARRLVGATKEELESDADELLTDLGLKKDEKNDTTTEETSTEEDKPAVPARPKEDLQGGASNAGDEPVDAGKLADSIIQSGF